MSNGPLEGLVVADFSRVLAGPFATMLLGDLGADVVKVEHPEAGDVAPPAEDDLEFRPEEPGGHSRPRRVGDDKDLSR